ncbi:unnamed protein product [marine sediment metagenome]|uniref:Type II toxin-antitoxin system HicA family toxin n=1 Tax=marine sediment metagenome TaxID=412755 RepID=X1EBY6_9ZZZZ
MDKREIYQKLKGNPADVRFEEICKAAKLFGFRFRGGKGSHRIYVRAGVREMLNFQEVKGKAKAYQVKHHKGY